MRDTDRLRQRVCILACLPFLSVCENREPEAAARTVKQATAPEQAPSPPPSPAVRPPEVQRIEGPPSTDDPRLRRFMPIAGDPPYIDGYDPEEATCVSGNWCADRAHAARLVASTRADQAVMNCPIRLSGSANASIDDDPAYSGISKRPNMQASLNRHGTELARARQQADDLCCYHWFEYCSGRPLIDESSGAHHVASTEETPGWSADARAPDSAVTSLLPGLRENLRDRWLRDAAAEHASIAAFARQTLELIALGAPADLLRETQRAALDEIEHASGCYALARTFDPRGRAFGPGPLSTPSVRPRAWSRLVADTFAEGCVAETIAALRAERALRDCVHEPTRALLVQIAQDESHHAALAWRTLAWALQRGGETAKRALFATADDLAPRARPATPAVDTHDERLRGFGALDPEEERRVALDAWHEIVEPMVRALI